jgi:(E)-benzylidenesuccinyl-CoA hydratase
MSNPPVDSAAAPVLVQQTGRALVLTINRPDAGNSISVEVADAVCRSLRAHQKSKEIWAVILTGAGGRFFCTGGDLKAYQSLQTSAQLARAFGKVRRMLDELEGFSLPVIAAIDGYAVGGGGDLALACDLRIASAEARIAFLHTRVGLISGWNGVERLVATVGRSTAMKLLLTAEKLSAADARALGLVDIVTDGSALEEALRFTERLGDAAPLTLRAVKRAVLASMRMSPAGVRKVSADIFRELWFSADHREAERAFVEKRRPAFRGK